MFTWLFICAIAFGLWGLVSPVHGTLGVICAICAVAIAIAENKHKPKE